jgi:hypothetical protein
MASFFPLYEFVEDLSQKYLFLITEPIASNSSREQPELQDEKHTLRSWVPSSIDIGASKVC